MKMKIIFFVIAFNIITLCQAAQFTVFNQSNEPIWIRPSWKKSRESLYKLEPSQSKFYDSGAHKPISLYWEERGPRGERSLRKYWFEFDVSRVALGGVINIEPDGHYNFSWRTLGGEGEGVAESPQ